MSVDIEKTGKQEYDKSNQQKTKKAIAPKSQFSRAKYFLLMKKNLAMSDVVREFYFDLPNTTKLRILQNENQQKFTSSEFHGIDMKKNCLFKYFGPASRKLMYRAIYKNTHRPPPATTGHPTRARRTQKRVEIFLY